MARVVMFTYVLLAGLATPALLYAAGGAGDSTPPHAATTAQAGEPGATTSTQAAPAPAAAPTPAPAPPPAPAPQAAPAAVPAKPAHPKEASVAAPTKPVKLRAVAHTAGSDTISDFKFTPSTITVSVGESVTWTNDGPTGHSATADDGSFDTGILSRGRSGSATFTKAGTYTFHCKPHPFMTGKVVVTAASTGGGNSNGASSSSSGSGSAADTSGSGSDSSSSGSSGSGTSGSSSSSLPNTGADAGAVALLGTLLLGGGIALRRRLAGDH